MAVSRNDEYALNMKKNPTELCAIVHTKQTLAIQNRLYPAGRKGVVAEDTRQPLKLYAEASRINFAVISEKTSVNCNLTPEELPGIFRKSDICSDYDFKSQIEGSVNPSENQDETSEGGREPAYTVTLKGGKGLKGKTPAQVILEAKNNEENTDNVINNLRNQYKWLKDNLKSDKYAKFEQANREQMDAILSAVNLYKKGELKERDSAVATKDHVNFTIYKANYKPNTFKGVPDSRYNGRKLCPVTSMSIIWTFGNKYPVKITITSFNAIVDILTSGVNNVDMSTKENEKSFSINLSADEWEYVLYTIKANMRIVEDAFGSAAYKTAMDTYTQNLAQSKN